MVRCIDCEYLDAEMLRAFRENWRIPEIRAKCLSREATRKRKVKGEWVEGKTYGHLVSVLKDKECNGFKKRSEPIELSEDLRNVYNQISAIQKEKTVKEKKARKNKKPKKVKEKKIEE